MSQVSLSDSLSLSRFLKFSGYIPSSIMDAYGVRVFAARLRQLREFVKPISSFTRPSTFGEATARIKHNLSYFSPTYAMFVLSIIYLSFSLNPDLMITFFIVYSLWLCVYLCYEGPLVVFYHITVNDRILLSVLGVLSVFFLLPYGVWLNVLVSILIGFAIVVIHAGFRGTEDLTSDLQQDDGDGDLLSDLQDGGLLLSMFEFPPLI